MKNKNLEYEERLSQFALVAFDVMTEFQIAAVVERWELILEQRGWVEEPYNPT